MHFQPRIFPICVANRQSGTHGKTPRLALLARFIKIKFLTKLTASVSGSSRYVKCGKSVHKKMLTRNMLNLNQHSVSFHSDMQ
ncbi:hypothetical protein Y032_0367g27 [Ancylostoma ceylanicum]|uniref:Uncharacterized protein n=1 Tax=Ancylostoma ceylanicum TaxID=53326 RepID=A0A016RVU4_9BILA|nr:hypothetical protein Y032_0367g27 [Ancylostoma ceylanicum]